MKNRNKIYDIYLSYFNFFKKRQELTNPSFFITGEFIKKSIEETKNTFISELPDIVLDEAEEKFVINKIKTIHSVFQDEGYALLGDYEHDYEWYKNFLDSKEASTYYWDRYKNYLLNTKHFPSEIVKTLENDTLYKIMSYMGNPNDNAPFSIRGLVVGDVQSGKTSNYLGLIAKAADAGYKVIFILTGTIESLRKQTQQRVEEGFIGYDSFNGIDVGVGRGDKLPKAFTSRAKDFVAGDDQNTTYRLSDYSKEPMIFVLKKNVSVLKKVYSSLKTINTSAIKSKIDYPALIIDDEADNASINTNKPDNDPTKINKYIRSLLSLFTRSTYVGFTATPFANVFISYDKEDEMLKDDLFPRDFIYALNSPSNYYGAKKYFVDKNDNIKFIEDFDENLFPMKHKKDWYGEKLFNSLYDAVNSFFIANAIRDIRDVDKKTHRSMLINMSRFTKVQSRIRDIIEAYYEKVKKNIKQTHKLNMNIALTNPVVKSLKNTFDKYFADMSNSILKITWEEVFLNLYNAISKINVVVVNSGKNSSKLNYEDSNDGLRVIAVGGLALSRGLTLEGLLISYFYRNTATFDVLMQMGRWFGYRDGYADLCKIWLTKTSYRYYKDIYESTEELKQDIRRMGEQNKRPEDYGIRVRNDSIDLGITAANKMRNTKNKADIKSYFGSIFETPYISRNLDDVEHNIDHTLIFLNKITLNQRDYEVTQHPYFRGVPTLLVEELLDNLKILDANENFDTRQISSFLKKNENQLNVFDVLVIGGKKKINGEDNPRRFVLHELDINIPLVSRGFDIPSDTLIRMSGTRAHLWGSSDPKYGLKEDEIPQNASKAQDYLIEDRKPLLIIYFINPNNNEETDEEERFTSISSSTSEFKFNIELFARKYNFLVGYAIGFPKKVGENSKAIMYTVNKSVNYYDKNHDNESEEI
ncbi:MAG: DEAD/DEAH box helicase family protein [Erysipelotrichales bacterium]|nr:DEAD/DEAH box helicase family protein [Erysipelotrichales bacterium]